MPRNKSVMALSFVLSLAAVAACSSEADVVPPAPEAAPLEGTTDALPSEVSPPSVYGTNTVSPPAKATPSPRWPT